MIDNRSKLRGINPSFLMINKFIDEKKCFMLSGEPSDVGSRIEFLPQNIILSLSPTPFGPLKVSALTSTGQSIFLPASKFSMRLLNFRLSGDLPIAFILSDMIVLNDLYFLPVPGNNSDPFKKFLKIIMGLIILMKIILQGV